MPSKSQPSHAAIPQFHWDRVRPRRENRSPAPGVGVAIESLGSPGVEWCDRECNTMSRRCQQTAGHLLAGPPPVATATIVLDKLQGFTINCREYRVLVGARLQF